MGVPPVDPNIARLAELMGTLAGSLSAMAEARALKDSLKPDKPHLTAADPKTHRQELKHFRIYMDETRVTEYSRRFRAARAVASGHASVVVENFTVAEFRTETCYQQAFREFSQAR